MRALLLALTVALLAAPAASADTIVVKAPTVLRMSGSDIYCSVNRQRSGTITVACFHHPDPTSKKIKGYAVAASDDLVAVEPPGSTKPNVVEQNPSLTGRPAFAGGSAHKEIIVLALQQGAVVSGTHMVITVQKASGGGNAMGVLLVDAKGPIPGTYSAGVSNTAVTVIKVSAARKPVVVYKHSVY